MALYLKQDFSPPVLSRRWLTLKFRPNMLLYSRHHVITILESGLLFREDSIEVEEGMCVDENGQWLTRGERVAALCAVAACIAVCPPKNLKRSVLIQLTSYAAVPVVIRTLHRLACKGTLPPLIDIMRDYLILSRRAAACVKEFAAMRADIGSVSSAVQSTHTMLCRQQQELVVAMSRASSALLGNAPWLRSDLAWEAIQSNNEECDNFLKLHHAFLVVQSTLLKHIAMAHFLPSVQERKLYKNQNERIYWLHTTLIPHLTKDFKENYEALERMYRLLKNFGNSNTSLDKKPGKIFTDSWIYSEVHTGVARSNLELKLALEKCNSLDLFLDSCALNKQKIDLDILNKDLEEVIECILRSLSAMQNSQLRLQKIRGKTKAVDKQDGGDDLRMIQESDDENKVSEIEMPQPKDEVFYFVKTEDDDRDIRPMADTTTMPGRKEREATKIVLKELKRKLVKREDLMRERERQALINTMPELKNNFPEFPRQMNVEDNKGKDYKGKTQKPSTKKNIHKIKSKIKRRKCKPMKYKLVNGKLSNEKELGNFLYETNSKVGSKVKILSFNKHKDSIIITSWRESWATPDSEDLGVISCTGLNEMNVSPLNASVMSDHSAILELNLPEEESVSLNCDHGDIQPDPLEDGSSVFFKSIFENRSLHENHVAPQNGGGHSFCSTQTGAECSSSQNIEQLSSFSFQNGGTPSFFSAQNGGPGSSKNLRNSTDVEEQPQTTNNYKFSKSDLESSTSDSDLDLYDDKHPRLLHDVRRRRPVRKKNVLGKRGVESAPEMQDENLRPMEYSLSAGLAMAGVLQGGGGGRSILTEEVFSADGDVDVDSGNEL